MSNEEGRGFVYRKRGEEGKRKEEEEETDRHEAGNAEQGCDSIGLKVDWGDDWGAVWGAVLVLGGVGGAFWGAF